MTKARNLMGVGLLLLVALLVLIMHAGKVRAATIVPLDCVNRQINLDLPKTDAVNDLCDLSIDKQVSINGGAFVEADTPGDAANAQLGNIVIWKIIVANTNPLVTPRGFLYITDVLPSGVTYGGIHAASIGTYNGNDGSPLANTWFLPLTNSDFFTNLPATLTITTTAHSTGLTKNTAFFNRYDPGDIDGGVPYVDEDSANDSDDAWISVPVPAKDTDGKVLGASTLVDTGDGLTASLMAGSLIVVTLGVVAYARFSRKPNTLIQ